jgi:hypothetical protein
MDTLRGATEHEWVGLNGIEEGADRRSVADRLRPRTP